MIEIPFRFKDEFIDEFFKGVSTFWANSSSTEPIQLPEKNVIKELIEVSSLASTAKEEGRSVTFTLTYGPKVDHPFSYILETPLPFNVDTLIKIAPALMLNNELIGVMLDEKGKLSIWGFTSLPSHFRLFVIEPMKLILHCYQVEAVITHSRAFLIGNKFTFLTSVKIKYEQNSSTSNQLYTDNIGNLAIAVRNLGHGGTILIVPNNDKWKESIKEPIRLAATTPYDMVKRDLSLFDEAATKVNEEPEGGQRNILVDKLLQISSMLHDSLAYIASLTAVDGAVIVNYNFDIFAFGAKIKAKTKESPDSIRYMEPIEGTYYYFKEFADVGGTRHQSAAQFVFDQKDTVALVVSQDKKVTIFFWDYLINNVTAFTNAEFWFLSKILFSS